MSSFNYKHRIEEIGGHRCSLVETGITKQRLSFLKDLLETNAYVVETELMEKKDENDTEKYKIGVTDLLFNPVIAVYERRIKTAEGLVVSPKYWFEETTEIKPFYWLNK